LKNPVTPSSANVFLKQSNVPLYLISIFVPFLPDYIINFLLTVSNGNEIVSDVVTTN